MPKDPSIPLKYLKHYHLYHSQVGHNEEIKEKKKKKQAINNCKGNNERLFCEHTGETSNCVGENLWQNLFSLESFQKNLNLTGFGTDRLPDWDSQGFLFFYWKSRFMSLGSKIWTSSYRRVTALRCRPFRREQAGETHGPSSTLFMKQKFTVIK